MQLKNIGVVDSTQFSVQNPNGIPRFGIPNLILAAIGMGAYFVVTNDIPLKMHESRVTL